MSRPTPVSSRPLKRIRMPQNQRNREFWLLLFAVRDQRRRPDARAGWAHSAVIDPMILAIGGGLAALAFALHIVLRFVTRPTPTRSSCPSRTLLTGLGIAMIYRIDIAFKNTGWNAYSTKQLARGPRSRSRVRSRWSSCCATTASCSGTPTSSASPESCSCCCRSCPACASRTRTRRSGCRSAVRSPSSRVSSQRFCLAIFFAGYLVRTPREPDLRRQGA